MLVWVVYFTLKCFVSRGYRSSFTAHSFYNVWRVIKSDLSIQTDQAMSLAHTSGTGAERAFAYSNCVPLHWDARRLKSPLSLHYYDLASLTSDQWDDKDMAKLWGIVALSAVVDWERDTTPLWCLSTRLFHWQHTIVNGQPVLNCIFYSLHSDSGRM